MIYKDRPINIARSLIIVFLKIIKSGGLGGGINNVANVGKQKYT